MKKKHIILIGGWDYEIKKISDIGIDLTLFQKAKFLTPLQLKLAKRVIVTNYENIDETLILVKTISDIDPFDNIMSFTEYGLYPAAYCADKLNIDANPLLPVLATRNKIEMRKILSTSTLSHVKFKLCQKIEDVKEFFQTIKSPIILKPTLGSGSAGVSLIKDANDIQSAWEWSTSTKIFPMLAEEFIEGPEFSVESLSMNNEHEILVITEKISSAPHFIEIGHQMPARLSVEQKNKISDLVINFLHLIKQKTGPAHTEIRMRNGEPIIIESQTRIGGGQIYAMTELVCGVDMVTETLCHQLNIEKPKRIPKFQAAAVRIFTLENVKIIDIKNVEETKTFPGVIDIKCDLTPGKTLTNLVSSSARQGYVLAVGRNVEAAIKNVNDAFTNIVITYVKVV